MDIIEKISNKINTLQESDLDWIKPEIHTKYSDLISSLSIAAKQTDALSKAAFEENAKLQLNQALDLFLFKKKHWQKGVNLNLYLFKVLFNLKSKVIIENSADYLVNKPICPLCKIQGKKEFLTLSKNFYSCKRCEDMVEFYSIKTSSEDSAENSHNLSLHKIFMNHSKKGVRCPDCRKWMPDSAFNGGIAPCIYNCGFIGEKEEYNAGTHPVALTKRNIVSFDQKNELTDLSLSDKLSGTILTSEDELSFSDSLEEDMKVVKSVLLSQQKGLTNTTTSATLLQKQMMYQAFLNILDKMPYEMTAYLAHQKNVSKTPLQCQIFQEYADLIIDCLPFNIVKGKNNNQIVDLCDPRLSLFLGISTYNAKVKENGIIPNLTIENYIGGKNLKDYGPCFIGKLI
ncbi:MAG: hypothetical protein RLY43_2121, partial [Bacteroidota bacterium]